jgi:predicted porin
VGNGSVWQVNAGLGYRINKSLSLMVTGGRMQAPTGDFSANVIGVSLGYRFGLPVN